MTNYGGGRTFSERVQRERKSADRPSDQCERARKRIESERELENAERAREPENESALRTMDFGLLSVTLHASLKN